MSALRSEPVRVYLGGLLTTIVAALAFYGVIEAEAVPIVLAVLTALLAVPTVEVARSKVTPVRELTESTPNDAGHADGYGLAIITVVAIVLLLALADVI